jgi:processive 1,2-diacylglycerol beta-glucosyltransferase
MKILIIHASAGAGHQKAAEALFAGFEQSHPGQAKLIDILNYTNPLFKKMYRGTYVYLVTKLPFVWKFVFELLDIPLFQPVIHVGRRIYNYLNTASFRRFLIDENFDYILTTHFMAGEVVSALKKNKQIDSKLIVVVTDFDVHRIWLASGVDTYCVATDWTKEKVKKLGISEQKIKVTGIPTHEKFSQSHDISGLKQKMGLEKDAFTVLLATGSFGIGPIEEIMNRLDGFQVVVVCGHNQDLYRKLSPQETSCKKVFGLVNNMHELMAVSDVMVTKPGGLSISEALVSHLPMIFFNAIPGQETNNIAVLKTYGIGVTGYAISQIVQELNQLKSSKDLFLTALRNTKSIARPNAVNDVVSLVV